MVLRDFVATDRMIRGNSTKSDYDKFCEGRCRAIEIVLERLGELEEKASEYNRIDEIVESITPEDIERAAKEVEEKYVDKEELKKYLDGEIKITERLLKVTDIEDKFHYSCKRVIASCKATKAAFGIK